MSDSKPKLDKRVREPSALSSEYHKAHKQLMLWATILFIWELVGVDLSKAKDAGGNVGPIVTALKSPQAVPWVLLILVLYFLFKCSVEWGQCNQGRRKVLLARVDFISALSVSGAAIALYVSQAISRVQFADVIQSRSRVFFGFTYGIGAAALLVIGTKRFASYREGHKSPFALPLILTCWGGSFVFVMVGLFALSRLFLVIGMFSVLVPRLLFPLLKKRLRTQTLPKN
jgi:hypothetical protein